MKKMIFLLVMALTLPMTGCQTQRIVTTRLSDNRDTTIIREIVRDTTIVVKPDSSMLQALIECDSMGQAHIKELLRYKAGVYLKPPQIVLKDNILTITANTDSLKLRIGWLERELYNIKNATYIEYRDVPVNYLTWWQKLWGAIGKISTVLLVMWMGYKIYKLLKFR